MRLSEMQKAEILAKMNDGVNGNRLAKDYGVAKSTISLLKKRKYDEMLQSSKKSGTFDQSPSVSGDESIQSKNAFTSDMDEIIEKKPPTLSMFQQLKLYKPSFDENENQHNYDDTASEYDDDAVEDEEEDELEDNEDEESEDEEEDLSVICAKLRLIQDSFHLPTQTLRVIFELFSKLNGSGLIE